VLFLLTISYDLTLHVKRMTHVRVVHILLLGHFREEIMVVSLASGRAHTSLERVIITESSCHFLDRGLYARRRGEKGFLGLFLKILHAFMGSSRAEMAPVSCVRCGVVELFVLRGLRLKTVHIIHRLFVFLYIVLPSHRALNERGIGV
jgi:hypothetical protein